MDSMLSLSPYLTFDGFANFETKKRILALLRNMKLGPRPECKYHLRCVPKIGPTFASNFVFPRHIRGRMNSPSEEVEDALHNRPIIVLGEMLSRGSFDRAQFDTLLSTQLRFKENTNRRLLRISPPRPAPQIRSKEGVGARNPLRPC